MLSLPPSPANKPFPTGMCSWLPSSPKAHRQPLSIQCPLQQAASLDSVMRTSSSSSSNALSTARGLWSAGWKGGITPLRWYNGVAGCGIVQRADKEIKRSALLPKLPIACRLPLKAGLGSGERRGLFSWFLGEPVSATPCSSHPGVGARMVDLWLEQFLAGSLTRGMLWALAGLCVLTWKRERYRARSTAPGRAVQMLPCVLAS